MRVEGLPGTAGLAVKLAEVRVAAAGCRGCVDRRRDVRREGMLSVQQRGRSSASVTEMGSGELDEDLDECAVKRNSWAARSSAKGTRAARSSAARDFESAVKRWDARCGAGGHQELRGSRSRGRGQAQVGIGRGWRSRSCGIGLMGFGQDLGYVIRFGLLWPASEGA